MNFTREPIIETVITPREGCKLVVRSSKGGQEEYFVDAVEVVSFGHSFFFRSLERPKSFLVPASDYEILELKETRMVLKNVSGERSIKIGGGREGPVRSQQPREPSEEIARPEGATQQEGQGDRKQRDRRRSRRRRGGSGSDMRYESASPEEQRPVEQQQTTPPIEGAEKSAEEPPAPSFISKLFPPPSTLIKDTISRYKMEEEKKPSEGPSSEQPKTNPDETTFED